MRRPRRFLPDSGSLPFLPLPDEGEGADGGAGGAAGGDDAGTADDGSGTGDAPKFEDMTVDQREAFWKRQARDNETKLKATRKQLADAKPKIDEYERLVQASKSESEKAVEAAKVEALRAGRAESVPQILAAELRAATGGKIDAEAAARKVSRLDKASFLDDNGLVDMTKVAEWVKDETPAEQQDGTGRPPVGFPDLGQGQRGNSKPVSGAAAGLEEAKRRGWIKPAGQQSA